MRIIRRRGAALLLSAFATSALLGLAASPAQAASAGATSTESSSTPGLLHGLVGDGGLVSIFIGNYQVRN
ncbi:hypothetical protein [Nocardiopsis sp. JB363]|uniref:hypothetical protein n=1 Tax=Nocardiopsis sp. JB363 TaxID=1434837 RepID=UPI00097A2345|nr:hypothetical protein [Nocardiopsis sp. JB363]SIO85509.1 hypothetical protein BQ8420_07310 [Nocardiopsis sp. JB363]